LKSSQILGKGITVTMLLIVSGGFFTLRAQVVGGMLNPDVDEPGKPFSYFWHPTDVIGALYAPVATEVTPEGYLYTGFGELMFFVGNPLQPTNQRIKTLLNGYLPIVQYELQHDGVKYSFSAFAAGLELGLDGLPLNLIRVELKNETRENRHAFLSSAYRFMPPVNRLDREVLDYRFLQRFDLVPKQYAEGQSTFNPDWKYAVADDALVRDGRVLYFFPSDPKPWGVSLALGDNGLRMYRYFSGEIEGESNPKDTLDPQTPMGVVTYRVSLEPGQARSLVFKMPIAPIPENSAEASQARKAEYAEQLKATVSSWQGLVGRSQPLKFPEQKVQEYLLANTIFDLLAIDRVGDDYIPNVNKFQYHQYYPGNCSDMVVAFDYAGLPEIARKALLYQYKMQAPDGSLPLPYYPTAETFIEQWGLVLWAWTRHYELTRDASFLHEVYPGIERAMAWEERTARGTPSGLMPPSTVGDDAYLKNSRQTGQSIWILIGLRSAIRMAEAAGNQNDASRFEAEYHRYRDAFEKLLAVQTAKSGGYIPPSLDRTLLGNNWDNLLTLYPEPLFDPYDPRVTATIRESRKTYSEGILGYVLPRAVAQKGDEYVFDSKRQLHYWQSQNNAENALVRGSADDQRAAVADLYALLLHTTSTHAPQEFGTYPWGTRDYVEGDILPDGAASAKTIELLRNMLVREYKNDLYLFSAVSPEWLKQGKKIEVVEEPTTFGPVSAVLTTQVGGFEVRLSNRFRQAPEHVVIPVPWFYEATSAEADGRPVEIKEGRILLSTSTKEVVVKGRKKEGAEELSYERAVENYKREYTQRYQEFLRTGSH
jgi:hypothetical protein